jgi:hypothetical protein
MKQFFFNLWNNFQRIPTGGYRCPKDPVWPLPPETQRWSAFQEGPVEKISPVAIGLVKSMVNEPFSWVETTIFSQESVSILNASLNVVIVGLSNKAWGHDLVRKDYCKNCKYLSSIDVRGLNIDLSDADKKYIAEKIEEHGIGQIGALVRQEQKRIDAEKHFAELSLTK